MNTKLVEQHYSCFNIYYIEKMAFKQVFLSKMDGVLYNIQ